MDRVLKNQALGILAFLFLLNLLAGFLIFDLAREKYLKVSFFDVGQGDAAFIAAPQGYQILIDGGPGGKILEKLGKEMPFWDRSIDLVVLSHPESDHIQGLLEVLKKYKIENILWTGAVRDTPEFQEWELLIKEEGAKIEIARAGQRIVASDMVLEILAPLDNVSGKEVKDSNDTSIVGRLVFKETSFLFTGDVSKTTEKKIADKNIDIDSDVLKVGHHGSKTSSMEEFISKVSPEIAVISLNKDNTYGHPHQETLDTLAKYVKYILRTDEKGDIKLISDGKEIKSAY